MRRIILAGMPNCGKSSIFNLISGSDVYVGNRAGVTVKQSSAPFILPDGEHAELVDIPGITSLTPRTADEDGACRLLYSCNADLIVNVIDVTVLAEQLILTMRLCELFAARCPILICLNMCDCAEKHGQRVDAQALIKLTGLPAVCISAVKKSGTDDLLSSICELLNRPPLPAVQNFPESLAKRHKFAEMAEASVLIGKAKGGEFSKQLGRAVCDKRFGIPLFILVLAAVMYITFGHPGIFLTRFAERAVISPLSAFVSRTAERVLVPMAASFVNDGIIGGVCSVLSFFPRIMLMFICLCALEDCGYMSRLALIADPPLRKIGLDGRACISVLLGFGCAVPAVMSCRNMTDCRERTVCCSLIPLLSCSARVPVYSLFADYFFGAYGWLVALCIHLMGTVVFLLLSAVIRSLGKSGSVPRYVAALPSLRFPSPKHVIKNARAQTLHFFKRAGTVIFLVSCLTWFMTRFSFSLRPSDADGSILATLARVFSVILRPLGIEGWESAAALICGIGAKEAVVSVLSVLGNSPAGALDPGQFFTPRSALSFLVFFSMYAPCAATFITLKGEIGLKKALFSAMLNFSAAYLAAVAVNLISFALY